MTKESKLHKKSAELSLVILIFIIVSLLFLLTNYIHPIYIIFFGMVAWNFLVAIGYIRPIGKKSEKRKNDNRLHSKKESERFAPKERKDKDLEWALKIFGMRQRDLTKEAVKKRFHLLARKNHPDIVENPKISMYDITKAYGILKKAAV